MRERITFDLSSDEALVLYELLANFSDQSSVEVPSGRDRLALLRLHGAIERTMPEPFCFDYPELLAAARARLTAEDEWFHQQ